MAKDKEQLRCVDLTKAVEEDVDAAVRFLGQLSGRLVAVERFRTAADERVLGAGVPIFCARLWLIEEMSEADARAVGLKGVAMTRRQQLEAELAQYEAATGAARARVGRVDR